MQASTDDTLFVPGDNLVDVRTDVELTVLYTDAERVLVERPDGTATLYSMTYARSAVDAGRFMLDDDDIPATLLSASTALESESTEAEAGSESTGSEPGSESTEDETVSESTEDETVSESIEDETVSQDPTPVTPVVWTTVDGIGERAARSLYESDRGSAEAVAHSTVDELTQLPGIGVNNAENCIEHAETVLARSDGPMVDANARNPGRALVFTAVPHIGVKGARSLRAQGYYTAADIRASTPEELQELDGIGTASVDALVSVSQNDD